MNKYMEKAYLNAMHGIENSEGGPFGAVVVDSNGRIVGNGNNRVLKNLDPTAHAEIVAIRDACLNLHTRDLSDCTLYTTCEPCPMCLSAIVLSNIKNFYFGCTRKDAGEIGFRDDLLYNYLENPDLHKDLLKAIPLDRDDCLKIFQKYTNDNGTIY